MLVLLNKIVLFSFRSLSESGLSGQSNTMSSYLLLLTSNVVKDRELSPCERKKDSWYDIPVFLMKERRRRDLVRDTWLDDVDCGDGDRTRVDRCCAAFTLSSNVGVEYWNISLRNSSNVTWPSPSASNWSKSWWTSYGKKFFIKRKMQEKIQAVFDRLDSYSFVNKQATQ